ncbi:MAG: UDP-N-acetylmuramoyl-L-alanyl-D-glutamate--2,6-diaminopimelate ligase [Ruminococcaceae bacterium]|nr:UDP-N-acetylmuramoyl-L-alanyl-D-glutamate--2,6-diaminopimelate ligase [Oscillospiraceae bacterium]
MKVSEVIGKIKYSTVCGDTDAEIFDVCIDNRICKGNDAFVCIKGFTRDAHEFAESAISMGASALFVQDEEKFRELCERYGENKGFCVVLVQDTRKLLPELSDVVFRHPSGELNLIGVTGTKGKTTTTYMIKNIYDKSSVKTGLIGTICNMIGDEVIKTERTTPEANVTQKLIRDMVNAGVKTCIMEASSQGLNLNRVGGCEYNIGVFTNLSHDHIGPNEHKDMDDYANAKSKLFTMCKKGLINIDSPYSDVMIKNATCEVFTYGIDNECDFRAVNVKLNNSSVEYDICGKCPTRHIKVSIPGKFSVYNSLAAIACSLLDGGDIDVVSKTMENIVVSGKAESVPTGKDFSIIIDYAHNPDSFINILTTVKAFAKRTVFLFGCGGDRNRPRALMGKTAGEYADFTIITSDNPRSEDPDEIIRDIEVGIKETDAEYVCITDRAEAIKYAIINAQPGDVIILAGKGHETYQIFKDKTVHFDEREVVAQVLAEIGG